MRSGEEWYWLVYETWYLLLQILTFDCHKNKNTITPKHVVIHLIPIAMVIVPCDF